MAEQRDGGVKRRKATRAKTAALRSPELVVAASSTAGERFTYAHLLGPGWLRERLRLMAVCRDPSTNARTQQVVSVTWRTGVRCLFGAVALVALHSHPEAAWPIAFIAATVVGREGRKLRGRSAKSMRTSR